MTIVAYYNDAIYADSAGVTHYSGNMKIVDIKKIHVSNCRRICLAKAGDELTENFIPLLLTMLLGILVDQDVQNNPYFSIDDVTYQPMFEGALLMTRHGTWRYESEVNSFALMGSQTCSAYGTGKNIFEMAAALGKTGMQALQAAGKYGYLCGGPLTVVKRSSLLPFIIKRTRKTV